MLRNAPPVPLAPLDTSVLNWIAQAAFQGEEAARLQGGMPQMAAQGYIMTHLTLREAFRLARYRARHPDRPIRQEEFGVWHAEIPLDETTCQYIAEHRLDDLLDRLDDMTGPHPSIPDG
jgi:hypothetical protein